MRYAGLMLLGAGVAAVAIGAAAETKGPAGKGQAPATKPATEAPADQVIREKIFARTLTPLAEPVAGGSINWTTGEILAVGEAKVRTADQQGIAMAGRGARLLAARNTVLMRRGIRVGPGGRFTDVKQGQVAVDAVLKGFREVSSVYDPKTQRVRVTLSVPIYGIDSVMTVRGLALERLGRRWYWPKAHQAGKADVVIIDARRCSFVPAVLLQIVTRSGQTVFCCADMPPGRRLVRPPAVYVYMKAAGPDTKSGNVYVKALARAKQVAALAGSPDENLRMLMADKFASPLILNADPLAKPAAGTLVLSAAAEKNLMFHGEARELLTSGKLIVVTDTIFKKK
ncbi:MAG: hypothetical protein QF577_07365 [Phycisphaerae bacterium]|jgi:hypothetical protein|nr:hypothetical protein [Phycisphaerae bacterium]